MNYKEFVQQAVIAWLPQMCWPVTIDSPVEGDVILAAKQVADRLVEEGLLDPPASVVNIKRGEPVIDFMEDDDLEEEDQAPDYYYCLSCGVVQDGFEFDSCQKCAGPTTAGYL